MDGQRERNPPERLREMDKRTKTDRTGFRQKEKNGQWPTVSTVNGKADEMKVEGCGGGCSHLVGEQFGKIQIHGVKGNRIAGGGCQAKRKYVCVPVHRCVCVY